MTPLLMLTAAMLAAMPLDGLFKSVDRPDTPGCRVDIRRDGVPIARRSYGSADLETGTPVGQDSVFEIGSVSKQFVGAGVAKLAADGRLSLDDPIVKWLPELPALYRGISVRMLLNHTSGIRSWNNLAELTGSGEDSTGYDNRWVLTAIGRQTRLNNAPGAEYLYSNSNYVLAATIIERASGQPLNVYFAQAFFDRLGMAHTRWRSDFREIVPGRAQAYLPSEAGAWRLDMPFNDVVGAGGLLSTTDDLQLWNATLAAPGTADRAWVASIETPGRLGDGTVLRYGLGLELAPVAGADAASHAGSTASYRAWLGRFPASRLSIALLCNAGSLNTEDLGPEIAALYLPAVAPAADAPASDAPASGTIPGGVAGLYRNAANDALVTVTAEARGVRFNGGTPFRARGDGVLATGDGTRTALLRRRTGGGVEAIRLSRIGNAPVELVRAEPWSPTPGELDALAGRYGSAEIDGAQAIVRAGGGLVWIDPAGSRHPLRPIYRDAFDASGTGWTLRFDRARRLSFSITRARQIRFSRLGAYRHSPHPMPGGVTPT